CVRYVDPGYAIRSVVATSHDSAFCQLLGQSAVHAAMSGRTNMVVGFWNHQLTHVPIPLAVSARKKIDPRGLLWNSVLASTGQPRKMKCACRENVTDCGDGTCGRDAGSGLTRRRVWHEVCDVPLACFVWDGSSASRSLFFP